MQFESSVPITHPMELPRIPGYRDYGFENLDQIVDFASGQIKTEVNKSFCLNLKKKKKFLLLSVVYISSSPAPYFEIDLEAGYIDFQDGEKVVDSSIKFRLHEDTDYGVLIYAKNGLNSISSDIDYAITQITNGDYLDLPAIPA